MKRLFLFACMALVAFNLQAQNSYIVKTKNAKKAVATASGQGNATEEKEQAQDFIGKNFKYYSLCDWKEGMKFMVLPEKYDMVVNTFCDAATDKEVSSNRLRYKIMEYKGHTETEDNHSRINFLCADDQKTYYYQIPNGTFEDYCFGKLGVPTLAYLGDVDIARSLLMGKKLYTKATLYREDTEQDGDGFKEVNVPKNEEVTVVAVGVGSRSYPVKIIVADKKGREFFQNVAMSKTNSGMRDDEFIMDNTKFTFYGSFELIDANETASDQYAKYVGRNVYTKYKTTMENEKGEKVSIARLSSFKIEKVQPMSNTNYCKLTLKSASSGAIYIKEVTFVNENVAGDIDGMREDYYPYLFGNGTKMTNVPKAHRKMIQQGKVGVGYTKDEVRMAKGEPNRTAKADNGREDWIYTDRGQIVKFNKAGKVQSVVSTR